MIRRREYVRAAWSRAGMALSDAIQAAMSELVAYAAAATDAALNALTMGGDR